MEKEELRLLRKSLFYAYEHVPFYKDRFDKSGIHPEDVTCFDDMLKVPLTTKEDLHEKNDNNLISDEYRKEDLVENRTSGSSGKPTVVYFDKRAFFYLKIVSKFRGKSYCGLRLWDKVLVISDNRREIVQERNSLWLAKLFSLRFMTTQQGFDVIVRELRKRWPTVVYMKPSTIRGLYAYLEKERIKDIRFRLVFTSGELLEAEDKKGFERFFGCEIYDIYGSAETKEIAWQCREKKEYHINSDFVHVEFVKDGRHSKAGEEGEIVLTSLVNRGMPLIRYKIEDLGVQGKDCSCPLPFPTIAELHGRELDYLRFSNGVDVSPYVMLFLMEKTLRECVKQYQAHQVKEDELVIRVCGNASYTKEIEERMVKKTLELVGIGVKVRVKQLKEIPLEKNGKYKVIKSLQRFRAAPRKDGQTS